MVRGTYTQEGMKKFNLVPRLCEQGYVMLWAVTSGMDQII